MNNNKKEVNRYPLNSKNSTTTTTTTAGSTKEVQFKVRFEDKIDSKPVVLPSLTKRGTGALKILHPNHLSRRFGLLQNSKEAKNNNDTNGDVTSSTTTNTKRLSSEASTEKNLFCSRLEDSSGITSSIFGRRSNLIDSQTASEAEAEFANDMSFNKIKPVVDSLTRKGLLTSSGELTPEAKIDDNCHMLNPRLATMIDWADCINARSANNKYIDNVSNRCKLVSMLYHLMTQCNSLSDKLSLSDKMNSKIAYNKLRLLDTCANLSSQKNPTSQPMKASEKSVASIPTPQSSNTQLSDIPQQTYTNENKTTAATKSESKTDVNNNNNKDTSLNFTLFDVSLESNKDKELLQMVMSDQAANLPPHPPVQHPAHPMERNDSEYIDDLAKAIVESAQSIIEVNLITLDEAIKKTSPTTDKKTLDRLSSKLKWLKTTLNNADQFNTIRLALIEVFKNHVLKQSEQNQSELTYKSLALTYSSIISRQEMFEMEVSEHQLDSTPSESTSDENNNDNNEHLNTSPTLLYVLNEFKIYLFDILNAWTLDNTDLDALRRLLHVDIIAISIDSEDEEMTSSSRQDPRKNARVRSFDVDFKTLSWNRLGNERKRLRHDSWSSREPRTVRPRLSVSNDSISLSGGGGGDAGLNISTLSSTSASYLPNPMTPRLHTSVFGGGRVEVDQTNMSLFRLLNQSSTPFNIRSFSANLEKSGLPLTPPLLQQPRNESSDDSDDFVEVAIAKVKERLSACERIGGERNPKHDVDTNEIKSILNELVNSIADM